MARVSKDLSILRSYFDEDDFIKEDKIELMNIDAHFIYDLKNNISYISEDRQNGKVLHSVESIVLGVIFAILANCDSFVKIHLFMEEHYEWLDKHIKFECGLPSLSTIKRVIGFINPKELEEICCGCFKEFLKKNEPYYRDGLFIINDIKTMDGKTANSSSRKNSKNGEVSKTNAMSLFSVKNDYCEATEFIDKKTNEIPTGLDLLKRTNIKDCIIVFDALNTQSETIKYIIKQHAHYVAPVKGNHAILEEQLKEYFDDKELFKQAKTENYLKKTEKNHGTAEKREYIFTNDIEWLYKATKWENITSIGIAIRTYINPEGKEVKDIRYYISDLSADKIEIISKAIREEWHIENKLHWYLDTVFNEDKNRSFLENSQKNLNIIRKFCLSILKIFKSESKLSMESIRFKISMNFENEIEKIINKLYETC